jgi:hypothetical protein
MTHQEAIAVKIYYSSIESVQLLYSSDEEVRYYKGSALNMKEYDHIMKSMYFDDVAETEELKNRYINIIAEYLTKLDDVYTGKVSLR